MARLTVSIFSEGIGIPLNLHIIKSTPIALDVSGSMINSGIIKRFKKDGLSNIIFKDAKIQYMIGLTEDIDSPNAVEEYYISPPAWRIDIIEKIFEYNNLMDIKSNNNPIGYIVYDDINYNYPGLFHSVEPFYYFKSTWEIIDFIKHAIEHLPTLILDEWNISYSTLDNDEDDDIFFNS